MSKVTKFLDKDPTEELRELLAAYRRTLDVQQQIELDRLLDELDMATDWYYSQNMLNKGRLRHAEADRQLQYPRFWAAVSAVERIFSKIADAAREQRLAASARERERMAELSLATDSRLLDRLRVVHTASKGKGDQGAFDVWNEVADILGEDDHRRASESRPASDSLVVADSARRRRP